jgi:hypothetical protein
VLASCLGSPAASGGGSQPKYSACSCCQRRTQALHHGARPSCRERSRLNSGAALQVIHGTGRPHDMPSPKRASFLPSHVTREQQPTHGAPRLRGLRLGSGTTPPVRPCPGGASRPRLGGTQARSRSPSTSTDAQNRLALAERPDPGWAVPKLDPAHPPRPRTLRTAMTCSPASISSSQLRSTFSQPEYKSSIQLRTPSTPR